VGRNLADCGDVFGVDVIVGVGLVQYGPVGFRALHLSLYIYTYVYIIYIYIYIFMYIYICTYIYVSIYIYEVGSDLADCGDVLGVDVIVQIRLSQARPDSGLSLSYFHYKSV